MSKKKGTEDQDSPGFLKSSNPIDITGDIIGAIAAIVFFGGAFLYLVVWPLISLTGYLSGGFFLGFLRSFKDVF